MFMVWSFLFNENTQKLQMLICVQTKYAMQKNIMTKGEYLWYLDEKMLFPLIQSLGYEFKKLAKICS
jgi:hypothetical protein